MDEERCSPYPHLSWLAHWLNVRPPRVFDLHERRHVAHHVLLTTNGDADVSWECGGATATSHMVPGCVGFFPCDQHVHSMAITSTNGFLAYELIVPDRQIRAVCAAEGKEFAGEFRTVLNFRDALLEASLLRLSLTHAGRQVGEDLGDDIAARQVVLRLCAISGAEAPDWEKDGSVFTPAIMRQLVATIDAHLVVPPSVASMAASVQLSPGHFARKFRNSAGLSLNRFLNARRIAASFALLQTNEDRLSGIALELGFASQSHFTRLFSGLTGMSPLQFRILHRRMVG